LNKINRHGNKMNDLLNSVIILYGGLDRGNSFHIVALDLSVGGARWGMKGQTGLFVDFVYEADIHKQRATLRPGAIFSDDIASRTRVQISYFGRDGLRLRHVHTVDLLGGAASAHYIGDDGDDDAILMGSIRVAPTIENSGAGRDRYRSTCLRLGVNRWCPR
jgi:hypothetical protein